MHGRSSECCARCCYHHVFGEPYESGYHYPSILSKEALQEEENEKKKERQRFDGAFDAHQKRIRSFCAVVEKKMLPEVRSIVYLHLLSNCATQHVLGLKCRGVYGDCESYFFSRSRMPVDPGKRTDVWRFSDYTGDLIGKEIAEAWYRNAQFMVYLGHGLVHDWLSKDVWQRGIVPAEIMRNIQVHVTEAACLALDAKKYDQKHSAGEELKLLNRLGNKKVRLTIELEVMRLEPLRAVADLVYELRSRGFVNITVRACCTIDCMVREKVYFHGVRKDRCNQGCKRRYIGYVFDVGKEVFDEVFGEYSTFLSDEASGGYDHRFRWRRAILGGNPEAVERYAAYPLGKDRPLSDYSWR